MKDKKFTIYVLHASHTDVGYTDTQEKMKAHHIAFIREVLALIKRAPRFKWNCESYWCVEQFLKVASPQETQAFVQAVKEGNIGLSASYLNLTDLVPGYVQDKVMADCRAQRESLGITASSAMTADVNGYSWGFADVLANHGVARLMSSIHTHHGYHPLMRKQTPFYWEGPGGGRVLCWNGDHYNLGNELGIAQAAWFEYTLQDGMSAAPLPQEEKAVLRIRAYVDTLLREGYEYTFAPVCVSGNMTDNSPPSLKILEFTDRFNAMQDKIELRMSTLDEFFETLEETISGEKREIPAYRGDWTDWWADGVGSTPSDVIQYRSAARSCHMLTKLDTQQALAPKQVYDAAFYNLMFYGEHTWGYSSSITQPYHPQVNNLDQWKRLYALKACEAATIARESVQAHFGETAVSLHGELTLRAVNPHDTAVEDMLVCDLEHFYGHEHFEVLDEESGGQVPFQISSYSRGPELCILLRLAPKQVKTFVLRELPAPALPSAGLCACCGIEGIDDLAWRVRQKLEQGGCATAQGMENQFFRLRFEKDAGVISVYDKHAKRELIAQGRPYGAFTPVYEVTACDVGEDQLWVRRNMGRNRKAFRTQRSAGTLYDIKILENGPLFSRAELKYKMEGVRECAVILTLYHHMPRIDADLRLHKDSVWEPENLYLSLPFAAQETWLDKAGAVLRPRVDQLPGTCVDFYAVQNGVVFAQEDGDTILACRDTPLVWMGTLEAHPIGLMGEDIPNCDETYAWVMNNFWETNFKAGLGGFYQFRYTLAQVPHGTPQQAFAKAEAINEGVLQFYRFVPRPDEVPV